MDEVRVLRCCSTSNRSGSRSRVLDLVAYILILSINNTFVRDSCRSHDDDDRGEQGGEWSHAVDQRGSTDRDARFDGRGRLLFVVQRRRSSSSRSSGSHHSKSSTEMK